MTETEHILSQEDVPQGWTYDPDWIWAGVSAAIHDDGYPVAPEPDYDTEHGYLIEINEEGTTAKLYRNDDADRHVLLKTVSVDCPGNAVRDLVAQANDDAQGFMSR